MRYAVAGDFPVEPSAGWMTALTAGGSAVLGALGLWIANRTLGKAAVQTALNNMAKDIIDQLQEERKTLSDMLAAERVGWAKERGQMLGRIANLEQTIQSLERRHGYSPGSPPPLEEPSALIVLPGNMKDET